MPRKGAGWGSWFSKAKNAAKKIGSRVLQEAKKTAIDVGSRAIDRGKDALMEGMATGDFRGAAGRAWTSTKNDAVKSARGQLAASKARLKADAKAAIMQGHGQMIARARGQGMSVGAGFGKAHFTKIYKHLHKHIDTIHSHALKHTVKSMAHIKRNGPKGAGLAKKQLRITIGAHHKKAKGAGWGAILGALAPTLLEGLMTKGSGFKVGAGVRRRKKGGYLFAGVRNANVNMPGMVRR